VLAAYQSQFKGLRSHQARRCSSYKSSNRIYSLLFTLLCSTQDLSVRVPQWQWPGLAPSSKCALVHFVCPKSIVRILACCMPGSELERRLAHRSGRAVTPAPEREPDWEPDWEACLVRKAVCYISRPGLTTSIHAWPTQALQPWRLFLFQRPRRLQPHSQNSPRMFSRAGSRILSRPILKSAANCSKPWTFSVIAGTLHTLYIEINISSDIYQCRPHPRRATDRRRRFAIRRQEFLDRSDIWRTFSHLCEWSLFTLR